MKENLYQISVFTVFVVVVVVDVVFLFFFFFFFLQIYKSIGVLSGT